MSVNNRTGVRRHAALQAIWDEVSDLELVDALTARGWEPHRVTLALLAPGWLTDAERAERREIREGLR